MYSRPVTLKVMLAAEGAFATAVRTHILFDSLWIMGVHVCFQVERTRKGAIAVRTLMGSTVPRVDMFSRRLEGEDPGNRWWELLGR
jgi:hypothetical protein